LHLPARDSSDHRLQHACQMSRRIRWGPTYALALAGALVPIPAWLVERWYSLGIYPLLQHVLTPASNLLPFPLFDVLWVAVTSAFAATTYRCIRAGGWRAGGLRLAVLVARGVAIIYLAFLAIWGLNYRRMPLIEKLA